jgi:hypothetical protein
MQREVKATQIGRAEQRLATNAVALLEAADEPSINETVVFSNISEHGARLITSRFWTAGEWVIVSDALVNFRARAEVIYCAPHSVRQFAVGPRVFAIGLRFDKARSLAAHFGDLKPL